MADFAVDLFVGFAYGQNRSSALLPYYYKLRSPLLYLSYYHLLIESFTFGSQIPIFLVLSVKSSISFHRRSRGI